jgi:hypothetical protein
MAQMTLLALALALALAVLLVVILVVLVVILVPPLKKTRVREMPLRCIN